MLGQATLTPSNHSKVVNLFFLGIICQGSGRFLYCFFLFCVWCCRGVRFRHSSRREKTQGTTER